MKNPNKAYIFDIDGTLVDSNDFHAHSWVKALSEFNYSIGFTKVRPLIGMGGDKLLKELTGLDNKESPGKAISERATAIFKEEYIFQIKPFPGVKKLISYLKDSGCFIVIATSADDSVVKTLLEIAAVKDMIDGIASSADVKATKPEPDLILAALQKIDCDKQDVLMVGDTRYDIEAAKNAGIRTIAFRCGGSPDIALKNATEIYENAEHFLHSFK